MNQLPEGSKSTSSDKGTSIDYLSSLTIPKAHTKDKKVKTFKE